MSVKPRVKKIILILLAIVACYGLILYQPGFYGVVTDAETGRPVPSAWVICITQIFDYSQLLNVGGANSHPDSLKIAISDSEGRFRVPSYFKFYPGFMDTRTVFVHGSGYDARRYFQQNYALVKDRLYGMPYASAERKIIPLAGGEPVPFFLSGASDSPLDSLYLAMDVEHVAFLSRENAGDPLLRRRLLDLYTRLRPDAELIKTRLEPHQVSAWENAMQNLARDLAL